MRIERPLSFLLVALAAAAIIVGAATLFGGGTQTTNAQSQGSATFTLTAPGGAQALNTPFNVTSALTDFTPGLSTTWGGYDEEISYDAAVVKVDSVTIGICAPAANWGNPFKTPHIVSGCAFQSRSDTGTLETISFECIADGTSPIEYLSRTDPNIVNLGSALFDENAVDYDMTFVNASVTCGSGGGTPTDTPVPPTATNTPIPPTATATATACNGACPTDTPVPPTATATNTAVPPTATNTSVPTATSTQGAIGVKSATPTPGGATSTASPAGTAAAATNTPSTGGPAATATRPGGGAGAGVTGPNTGDGGSDGMAGGFGGLWLILGGLGLGALGGGMYLRQRARRVRH